MKSTFPVVLGSMNVGMIYSKSRMIICCDPAVDSTYVDFDPGGDSVELNTGISRGETFFSPWQVHLGMIT